MKKKSNNVSEKNNLDSKTDETTIKTKKVEKPVFEENEEKCEIVKNAG